MRRESGTSAEHVFVGAAGSSSTTTRWSRTCLAAAPLDTLTLGPGDRAEIIVDTTDGPATLVDADFGRVLELPTDPDLPTAPALPEALATIDPITVDEIDRDRMFLMGRVDGGWGINGEQMDMSRIDETITFGDTERWTITVRDGIYTFHTHQSQFQILEINGQPPRPEDAEWEDTVLVTEDQDGVIAARFDTYTNPDTPTCSTATSSNTKTWG